MIVREDFLKKLRSAFDLNIYEVKIWTALLSKGVAAAGELSDISNVPRSRSYDVLEGLEKKGFVIMKLGKPIRYIAVKPEEIVKRLKQRVEEGSKKQLELLDNVRKEEVYREMELLFQNGIANIDPSNMSGAIKGRKNSYAHLNSLLANAKKSVTILTTSDGFVRKADFFKSAFKKLKEKGVKIRIATNTSESVKIAAKELNGLAEIKKLEGVKARFAVVDSKDVLMFTQNDTEVHESNDVGIWVSTPYFAQALESMVTQNWNKLEKI